MLKLFLEDIQEVWFADQIQHAIVIHGNALDHIPESYTRYLERTFLDVFKLQGTPLRIQYRTSRNPFADKKD